MGNPSIWFYSGSSAFNALLHFCADERDKRAYVQDGNTSYQPSLAKFWPSLTKIFLFNQPTGCKLEVLIYWHHYMMGRN